MFSSGGGGGGGRAYIHFPPPPPPPPPPRNDNKVSGLYTFPIIDFTLSQNQSESPHKSRTCQCWSRCNSICLVSVPDMCKQKPDIFRGFRFIPDRLGFSVQIQIIVNTVNIHTSYNIRTTLQHTYNFEPFSQQVTFPAREKSFRFQFTFSSI